MNQPKMNSRQAKIFWRYIQKSGQVDKMNDLLRKLDNKELNLKEVIVNGQEIVQRVILESTPPKPYLPFIKHFKD